MPTGPVYVRERGSGDHPSKAYWLYRARVGPWIVAEAEVNREGPIRAVIFAFNTGGERIDDIAINAAALAWQYWGEDSGRWSEAAMRFPTTRL